MAMKTVKQAMENMEYVRGLLWQKQPGFAASLELAAAQLERQLREPGMAPHNRGHARCPGADLASRAAIKRAMASDTQNAGLPARACSAGDPVGDPGRAGGTSD
ncbi:MAG TPA: hypothetical protein VHV09_03340 [Trebonia sp.]|jgi:hypothetical protein|nr:hypothetical protein [Trebonia sp.]